MIFLISNYQLNNNETEIDFEYMYYKYKNTVYSMISKSIEDRDLKNDCLQEIFLKFFKSMGKVHGEESSKRWLLAIAHNTIIDMSKKDSLYKSRVKLVSDENEVLHDYDAILQNLPLEGVLKDELTDKVCDVIAQMKPIHREVIQMKYYLEFTPREIASLCEIPIDTVYSRLRRAEEIIHKQIEKYTK